MVNHYLLVSLKNRLFQDSESSYVVVLFVSAYLFKQTFAIPGSVFLNALAGAVFGLQTGSRINLISHLAIT